MTSLIEKVSKSFVKINPNIGHLGIDISVKDSDLLKVTSLKKLPSETRTEALLVKYVALFGICH